MTEPNAFVQEFKPTIWHRLGFRGAYVVPWDDDGKFMTTEVTVQFDWIDRLRLLLTGRCRVFTRTKTDHDPGRTESRSDVGVIGPGW